MKKINKILTALGNPKKNKELRDLEINAVTNDIQYREGILEYLEKNKNINYLIIDEHIPGNMSIEKLIYEVKSKNKKLKIILISEKDNSLKIYKKLKKFNAIEIAKIIKNNNVYYKQQIPINDVFNKQTKDTEIITILGTNGIGKSIFSIVFSNQLENKKILIIDFDILNNSIHNLLDIKIVKNNIKEELKIKRDNKTLTDIHDYIVHTKYKIDLISGIKMIYNSEKQPTPSKIRNLITSIKGEYDIILIDTSTESLFDYTKELVKISDNSLFISGANMLEIKKSKRLLEIYHNDWKIPNKKISIIFNKYTDKSIDNEVLRRVFKKYNILGKIKLSDYYDLAINKNKAKIPIIEKEIYSIKNNYNKSKKLKINKIKK